MGRKSKYDDIDLAKLEDLAGKGFLDEELAHLIGISPATFYNYKRDNLEFLELIKRGKAVADEKVINALFINALGGFKISVKERFSKGKRIELRETFAKPDVIAQIFWLKNRRKDSWRDRQEFNLNLKEFKYVKYEDRSNADLKATAEELANRIIANRG